MSADRDGAAGRADALLSDAPETDRPALGRLSRDQRTILTDLLDGFDERRDVLEWMQELILHTVGSLEDEWFARTATSSPVMAALLGEPWGTIDEVRPETAEEIRRGLATQEVLPAVHAGTRDFRWYADEYYEDDDWPDPPDAGDQEHPGMRPGLSTLGEQMEWALTRLLDGFDSRDDVVAWGAYLTQSSFAEIDVETVQNAYFSDSLMAHFLDGTDPRSRLIRESWAAEYQLPAYNRAAASIASRSVEVPEKGSTEQQIRPG